MKPAPPIPVTVGSATQEAMPAATQASTALPPPSRTVAPTSTVTGWPAAIAPPADDGVLGATAGESSSAVQLVADAPARAATPSAGRRARRCRRRSPAADAAGAEPAAAA